MRLVVLLSERSRPALGERLEMLAATMPTVVHPLSRRRPDLPELAVDDVPYLLDVNRSTAVAASLLTARKARWVLDTGDHPATLARNLGKPLLVQRLHGTTDGWMSRHAALVVHRGSFHQALLGSITSAPTCFVPDTVDDRWLDRPIESMDQQVVCSFGSAGVPSAGDRAYGWEVVDTVARLGAPYRGILVVAGDGLQALQHRAGRLGVADRVDFHPRQSQEQLLATVSPAAFATSLQSFDLAGWVRTTGKLPLFLASGKFVITTAVGEASRVLPPSALLQRGDDDSLIEQVAAAITAGVPEGWADEARIHAEEFRRSRVARRLRDCLESVL